MRRHARKHVRAHSVKISPFDQVAFPSAFFTGARAGANPASSTRIHANQVRAHRDLAAGVSTALHCTHTRAHILHTHAHPFAEQESSRSLVAARGASAIPSFRPASACSPGPSTLRRNCRSHGRIRVKEWLDSCGALSTNMQRAEIDHVECRSHSDLLYNARGLKCATLAHALSLSQCLHKSSSDMSRAAAAARPSLLSISAKRNPKRPLHGALVAAVTPERPSRVHGQAEENGKPENSGKTHQKSWQIEIRS